jgi:hypothetical protein
MQYLNISDDKLQNLLRADCHAHDLQLLESHEEGVRVRGAEPVELKGREHAAELAQRTA